MLVDTFERTHRTLRISLTDKCNFRCKYCMPEEHMQFWPSSKLMQAGEIETIARKFRELGIRKIRLTGGEPLVRKDFPEIVNRLSKLPIELGLSTNGFLLDRYFSVLEKAGVKRINISLDSMDRERFRNITGRDHLQKVLENLSVLLGRNTTLKLNMVVMKGVNDDEVIDFVEFTRDRDVQVRFIEFMPFAGNKWEEDYVVPSHSLMEKIEVEHSVEKLKDDPHSTSRSYRVHGYKGSFGFISTVTQPFCSGCNRLRITADGKMRNCLFSKDESDLLSSLRSGNDIDQLIRQNVLNKEGVRGGLFEDQEERPRSMLLIGG